MTDLHPLIATSGYGKEPTQQVIRSRGHDEAGKEVDFIYVSSTNGDLRISESTHENAKENITCFPISPAKPTTLIRITAI
jgi:hypothetical protein